MIPTKTIKGPLGMTGIIIACVLLSGRHIEKPAPTNLPPGATLVSGTVPPNTADDYIKYLRELRDRVICPGFFDSPLGFKKCPARDELDGLIKIYEADAKR